MFQSTLRGRGRDRRNTRGQYTDSTAFSIKVREKKKEENRKKRGNSSTDCRGGKADLEEISQPTIRRVLKLSEKEEGNTKTQTNQTGRG